MWPAWRRSRRCWSACRPGRAAPALPEALAALRRSDEHFLSGRRAEGEAVLVDLMRGRGVSEATLLKQLAPRVAATERGRRC